MFHRCISVIVPLGRLPSFGDTEEFFVSVHGVAFPLQSSLTYIETLVHRYAPMLSPFGSAQPPSLLLPQAMAYVKRIGARFSRPHYVKLAAVASADFVWPDEVATRDLSRLRVAGSLLTLVEQCQAARGCARFNMDRVTTSLTMASNFAMLQDLASQGVVIDTPVGFVHQSSDVPLRPLITTLLNCQRTHALKAWRAGSLVLLPRKELSAGDLHGVHLNPTHWTPKPNLEEKASNVFGRPLVDPSNGPLNQVLNTDETRLAAIARYGKVDDPLIDTIVSAWYAFSRASGVPLSQCCMWKEDIENAFGQLAFQPRSSLLMPIAVDEQYIGVYLDGTFGWTGMPMAWGAVGRAIRETASSSLTGCLHSYVDDYVGLSPVLTADQDQIKFQHVARAVLGDSALSSAKSVSPTTKTDIIGWSVDLDRELIRPGDRGIDQLMFSFFSFDSRAPQ